MAQNGELPFKIDEEKIFDLKPYLEIGKFQELKDENLFKSVRVSFDSIVWANQLDLDPELLYKKSHKNHWREIFDPAAQIFLNSVVIYQ